jgi:hypothetical protein
MLCREKPLAIPVESGPDSGEQGHGYPRFQSTMNPFPEFATRTHEVGFALAKVFKFLADVCLLGSARYCMLLTPGERSWRNTFSGPGYAFPMLNPVVGLAPKHAMKIVWPFLIGTSCQTPQIFCCPTMSELHKNQCHVLSSYSFVG